MRGSELGRTMLSDFAPVVSGLILGPQECTLPLELNFLAMADERLQLVTAKKRRNTLLLLAENVRHCSSVTAAWCKYYWAEVLAGLICPFLRVRRELEVDEDTY